MQGGGCHGVQRGCRAALRLRGVRQGCHAGVRQRLGVPRGAVRHAKQGAGKVGRGRGVMLAYFACLLINALCLPILLLAYFAMLWGCYGILGVLYARTRFHTGLGVSLTYPWRILYNTSTYNQYWLNIRRTVHLIKKSACQSYLNVYTGSHTNGEQP